MVSTTYNYIVISEMYFVPRYHMRFIKKGLHVARSGVKCNDILFEEELLQTWTMDNLFLVSRRTIFQYLV